jgi:hypothetical protein
MAGQSWISKPIEKLRKLEINTVLKLQPASTLLLTATKLSTRGFLLIV